MGFLSRWLLFANLRGGLLFINAASSEIDNYITMSNHEISLNAK